MKTGDKFSKPSFPLPTVVEVIEVDTEFDLVTFKHKRRTYTLPISDFLSQFPERFGDRQKSGEDIHQDTAVKVFGVLPEEVTEEQRRAAKKINYFKLYGGRGLD